MSTSQEYNKSTSVLQEYFDEIDRARQKIWRMEQIQMVLLLILTVSLGVIALLI